MSLPLSVSSQSLHSSQERYGVVEREAWVSMLNLSFLKIPVVLGKLPDLSFSNPVHADGNSY